MSFLSKEYLGLEIKRSFKGNMIWSFSLGLSLLLIVAIYPMVEDMMTAITEMLEYLESQNSPFIAMMEQFGGIPTNAMEYFATEGAMFMQLLGGIHAAIIGFGAINKDEKERTAEVLYVLPISRSKLLTSKILSIAFNLFIFTIIQIALIEIGFLAVAPDTDHSLILSFGLFDYMMFLMIAYMSLGLAMFMKPNQSSLIAIAIPFPFYIMTIIASATNNDILKALKYASPFTFTEPVGWLKSDHVFELANFLIFTGITFIILIASYLRYKKRQII
jgi:ABC-2 type transport system permease protein